MTQPTTLRRLTREELIQAFQWCQKNGTADDWTILAMAYYRHGFDMNACYCFKKGDELRLNNSLPVTIASDDRHNSSPELIRSRHRLRA